jgi:hypothetical protein
VDDPVSRKKAFSQVTVRITRRDKVSPPINISALVYAEPAHILLHQAVQEYVEANRDILEKIDSNCEKKPN